MVDVYNTEAERRAAVTELTALRRELKTETSKGAKAAQSDPRFIAAQQRLDAAKSSAGMRTSAEDLAALNRIATSDTATMKKDEQGRMTAAPTRAERAVTKELNAPSKQYFKQVQQAYKNPDVVPNWNVPKQITPEEIENASAYNIDLKPARYDWVWSENKKGKGRWAMGIVGALENPPEKPASFNSENILDYARQLFRSDSATLAEANELVVQYNPAKFWNAGLFSKGLGVTPISYADVVEVIPNAKWSELQEVYYRLTLERDEDITVEDILAKYNELYGEGE